MGSICGSPRARAYDKEIYYKEVKSPGGGENISQSYKTPVKLDFLLENAEKGDTYKIFISLQDNADKFSTERIKATNYNVLFNTCYICEYFFERQQYLNISLEKNRNNQGYIKIPLGIVIGSPKSTYKAEIPDSRETLVIKANPLNDMNSYLIVDLQAKNLDQDFGEIKNKISYRIAGNDGKPIYDSESVNYTGHFDQIQIPLSLLEPNFTISFLNCYRKNLTYKQETSENFSNNPPNSLYVGLVNDTQRINIYNNSKISRHFTFIDYLKSGVTIKLTIGIDFTSSNLPPNDPDSHHYLGKTNDYELAIRACGTIVAYYDYNQSFPVYGFGAILKGQQRPNMCFNVNMKSKPEIYTIDNVINEYRACFNNIILAGPTEFCPLVQKVNETIKRENNPLKYHILMILTDGIIYDLQKTIDALVEGSFLPLSVIIIGIGDDSFEEMIQLDGDEIPLISSNGIKRMRDLVQFVPFNKYRNDPKELAAQVLEEVPRQIMEYYTMNNIYPYNLAKAQINKFGFNNMNINNMNSFNNMSSFNNNIGLNQNSVYGGNNNTYVDYLKKYKNDTYKSYLNKSKNSGYMVNSEIFNSTRKRNSNYQIIFDDEKQSRNTGNGSIYY